MAQYKVDFSEMEGDGLDWGGVWDPEWDTTTSGEIYRIASGEDLYEPVRGHPKKQLWIDGDIANDPVDKNHALSWKALGVNLDEIEALVCSGVCNNSNEGGGIIFRGAGTEGSETGVEILYDSWGGGIIDVNERDAGDFYNIAQFNTRRTIGTSAYNLLTWTRAKISGEKVWVKNWFGDFFDEPDAWQVDGATVAYVTGTGWFGLRDRTIAYTNLGAMGSKTFNHYDFVSVGTGGDEAPDPDSEPQGPRVTQMLVEVIRPFHAPVVTGAGQPVIVIISS